LFLGMNKKIVGIIPERMRSSRFPGKPLALIHGKPMVQWVYEGVKGCNLLDRVVVATGDKKIKDCVKGFGGEYIDTRDDHYRATNQVAEGLLNLEEQSGEHFDYVCMVQGDEPMVKPDMIRESMVPIIKEPRVDITNLMHRVDDDGFNDPNELKVVMDEHGFVLYFSRSPIPNSVHKSSGYNGGYMWKQVCVFGFKSRVLKLFPRLSETDLERVESIDMLRFLGHGYRILMVPTCFETYSVDTCKDLEYVEYVMDVVR